MRIFVFFVAFAVVSMVWGGKLKLPLEGGHFIPSSKIKQAHNDYILFLVPDQNLQVKAAQACLIKSVLITDNEFSILTDGEFKIAYGGLKTVFVKKGDKVPQGQTIGSLGDIRDLPQKPVLELYIQKQSKPIIDTNIFDRGK